MKDLVVVKSKTVNNESVPVVFQEIDPKTGEPDQRELSRPAVFVNFQATVPLKLAKILVKMKPDEFSIVGAAGELTGQAERIVKTAQEKSLGYKCEFCGSESKSKAGLTCHIRYIHPDKWQGKKVIKTEE